MTNEQRLSLVAHGYDEMPTEKDGAVICEIVLGHQTYELTNAITGCGKELQIGHGNDRCYGTEFIYCPFCGRKAIIKEEENK